MARKRSNGEGTVYVRKDGTYCAQYIATGIDIGNLPTEVEEWLHKPENREMVIDFYKRCKLLEAKEKLDNIK